MKVASLDQGRVPENAVTETGALPFWPRLVVVSGVEDAQAMWAWARIVQRRNPALATPKVVTCPRLPTLARPGVPRMFRNEGDLPAEWLIELPEVDG